MSEPTMTQGAGRLQFSWGIEKLAATISRARYASDGEASAEVLFLRAENSGHIHQCRLNLLSTRAQSSLAGEMVRRYDLTPFGFSWEAALEQLAVLTLRWLRQGDPVAVVNTTRQIESPRWLLEPIIPEKQPTLIFGLGASGKKPGVF